MDPAAHLGAAGEEIDTEDEHEEEVDDAGAYAQRRTRRVLRPVTDARADLRSDPLSHVAGDLEAEDAQRLVAGQQRRVARDVIGEIARLADERHRETDDRNDEDDKCRERGERHRDVTSTHDAPDALDEGRHDEGDDDTEDHEDDDVRQL